MFSILQQKDLSEILPYFEEYGVETIEDFFNLEQKDLDHIEMMHYLDSLKLPKEDIEKYIELFRSFGITKCEQLLTQPHEDIRDMGVKPFHAKKIITRGFKVPEKSKEGEVRSGVMKISMNWNTHTL